MEKPLSFALNDENMPRSFGPNITAIYDTRHRFVKRWPVPPIDNAKWREYICRGTNLLNMMSRDDVGAGRLLFPPQPRAASPWINWPGDFRTWGYMQIREANPLYCDMSKTQFGIEKIFPGYGLSNPHPNLKCWGVQHGTKSTGPSVNEQTYMVNRRTLRATGADFSLIMNPAEGFLCITKQYSPSNEAEQRTPAVTELPDLQRSSDIVFGQWTCVARDNTANLKYIMIYSITNSGTGPTIARALAQIGVPLTTFPGVSFDMSTEEGQALLGSPNGLGVGFMLAQFKAQLGRKTVTKVDVFVHESDLLSRNPCMVFHIQDLPGGA